LLLIVLVGNPARSQMKKPNSWSLLERKKAQLNAPQNLAINATLRRSLSWLAHEGDLNRFLQQVLLEITATVRADVLLAVWLHQDQIGCWS